MKVKNVGWTMLLTAGLTCVFSQLFREDVNTLIFCGGMLALLVGALGLTTAGEEDDVMQSWTPVSRVRVGFPNPSCTCTHGLFAHGDSEGPGGGVCQVEDCSCSGFEEA